MTKAELALLKECIESIELEHETLERDADWFVSDCDDLIASAKEIIYGYLGIPLEQDEWDDDEYDG